MKRMDVDSEQLVRLTHASGVRLALALTGGGTGVISQLLEVPGGSRSILEAVVPYSSTALDAFLRQPPEQYCAEPTARLMAMAAFERGAQYVAGYDNLAGIGCTASLASDRPKRGAHRAYLAVQTKDFTASTSLELVKGARRRIDEEQLVASLVLNAVAEACGISERNSLKLLPDETPHCERVDAPLSWQELLWGQQRAICLSGSSTVPQAVFSGAFHPLHDAHREMAILAGRRLGCAVAYEISVENVDKPLLDYREIATRAAQFQSECLWLTRAPKFTDKVRLFPGATFLVGVDTMRRIAEPKYYGGDISARDRAVAEIVTSGCRFLVFGRLDQGVFQTLDDLKLPPALPALCQSVLPGEFRHDLSSTQLRQAK